MRLIAKPCCAPSDHSILNTWSTNHNSKCKLFNNMLHIRVEFHKVGPNWSWARHVVTYPVIIFTEFPGFGRVSPWPKLFTFEVSNGVVFCQVGLAMVTYLVAKLVRLRRLILWLRWFWSSCDRVGEVGVAEMVFDKNGRLPISVIVI